MRLTSTAAHARSKLTSMIPPFAVALTSRYSAVIPSGIATATKLLAAQIRVSDVIGNLVKSVRDRWHGGWFLSGGSCGHCSGGASRSTSMLVSTHTHTHGTPGIGRIRV